MLTPQLITEAADIYKKLKEIDAKLMMLTDAAYHFWIGGDGANQGSVSYDVYVKDDREFSEDIRALLIERVVKGRRILERRLAQIGAPVIPWPAKPPGA